MKYNRLGQSNLRVSALCLGTMMFGDQTDAMESMRIVDFAREKGVNFIDTADVYSLGRSEEFTGSAIRGDRDWWILATKVGNRMNTDASVPNQDRYSRKWLLRPQPRMALPPGKGSKSRRNRGGGTGRTQSFQHHKKTFAG